MPAQRNVLSDDQARSFQHDGLGRLDEAPAIRHIGPQTTAVSETKSDLRRDGPCFGERRGLLRRPSSTSLHPAQRDHWASAGTPQTVLAARQGKVGGHVVVRRSQAANSRDYFWTLTRFEGLTHFKISDGKQHVGRKDLDNCSSLWPADWTVSRIRFAHSTSDRDHR